MTSNKDRTGITTEIPMRNIDINYVQLHISTSI